MVRGKRRERLESYRKVRAPFGKLRVPWVRKGKTRWRGLIRGRWRRWIIWRGGCQ